MHAFRHIRDNTAYMNHEEFKGGTKCDIMLTVFSGMKWHVMCGGVYSYEKLGFLPPQFYFILVFFHNFRRKFWAILSNLWHKFRAILKNFGLKCNIITNRLGGFEDACYTGQILQVKVSIWLLECNESNQMLHLYLCNLKANV